MKYIASILIVIFAIESKTSCAQPQSNSDFNSSITFTAYDSGINIAKKFFYENEFKKASEVYTITFLNNKDLGFVKDRYNLACCYAKLNLQDSAFYQLFRIAQVGKFYNYQKIENEILFESIKKDTRWDELILIIKKNYENVQKKLLNN